MKLRTKKGMTLIEVLIAALIFSVALAALLQSIIAIVDIIDFSKDQSIAVSDLKNILERLRATPFDYITNDFPNGVVDGDVGDPYTDIVGPYELSDEHITVSYANPNADPLEIEATLSWLDKKGRSHNLSLSTFRTR